jgi:23S rRNA pseudouridine955/2504/2580 synthase
MITIQLTEQNTGQAVLDILQQHIPAAPLSYLRQLLRRGKVYSDGIALGEESHLHGYETLQLPDSARLRELCDSPLPKVTILLETEALLAVFKPAGLAIHSSVNHMGDNLTDRVRTLIHHRKAPYKIAPAHRLDIGTSGPVLFGKGRKATAELGRLLQAGQIKKTYLALVHGIPPDSGTLTTEVQVQDKIKEAATRFRVLGRCGNAALLEIELLSGRKHQIRQQCSDAGWPVYGDTRYGGPALIGLERLFLHCWQLSCSAMGESHHFFISSPLPGDLRTILRTMHIDLPSPT